MGLFVVGLSHRTAPLSLRERLSLPPEGACSLSLQVAQAVEGEAFALSTCNRVELYGASEHNDAPQQALAALAERFQVSADALLAHGYLHRAQDAVQHLLRVAASLDSVVVGEPQILGQLKEAFLRARAAGATGRTLNRWTERAFSVAKRVRSETGVGRAAVSVGSVAGDLAKQIFGELSGRVALLVGAGEMGELAARHLKELGVGGLVVANRSEERALKLAIELGARARSLADLPALLIEADIVITSTAATQHLIDADLVRHVLRQRKFRPLFFIDIAVPRNVAPDVNTLENVYLYDVDDLTGIATENMGGRQRAAEVAEAELAHQAEVLLRRLEDDPVRQVIVALRERTEEIKANELGRAQRRLGEIDERQAKALEALADGVANKLLHDVFVSLKGALDQEEGEQLLEAARRLFALKPRGE